MNCQAALRHTLDNLDKVSARIIKYSCNYFARWSWVLGEFDAKRLKAIEFLMDVVHLERSEGDSISL